MNLNEFQASKIAETSRWRTEALPSTAAKISAAGSTVDGLWLRRLAPQSEGSYGVVPQQEPIYVVDPQGRVVRTLKRRKGR